MSATFHTIEHTADIGVEVEAAGVSELFEGAAIVKAMSACAEETLLLADSSKYAKTGFVNVIPLSEVDGVITDSGLGEDAARALAEASI